MISGTDLTHVISTKAQYSQVLEIPMISGSDINHVLSTKARCLQLVKSSHDLGSRPQLRNFDKGSVTLELAEVRAVPPVVILQASTLLACFHYRILLFFPHLQSSAPVRTSLISPWYLVTNDASSSRSAAVSKAGPGGAGGGAATAASAKGTTAKGTASYEEPLTEISNARMGQALQNSHKTKISEALKQRNKEKKDERDEQEMERIRREKQEKQEREARERQQQQQLQSSQGQMPPPPLSKSQITHRELAQKAKKNKEDQYWKRMQREAEQRRSPHVSKSPRLAPVTPAPSARGQSPALPAIGQSAGSPAKVQSLASSARFHAPAPLQQQYFPRHQAHPLDRGHAQTPEYGLHASQYTPTVGSTHYQTQSTFPPGHVFSNTQSRKTPPPQYPQQYPYGQNFDSTGVYLDTSAIDVPYSKLNGQQFGQHGHTQTPAYGSHASQYAPMVGSTHYQTQSTFPPGHVPSNTQSRKTPPPQYPQQ
ncbi:MAG: hypothetical protein CYPHOPRED_004285, partial [Cyphobasidiales sp. Tagirdzhanova-0007]